MTSAPLRFAHLDPSHSPGQQESTGGIGDSRAVDFSHGDVDAFPPPAPAITAVARAIDDGGTWAYSPYRGHGTVRAALAGRLADLTGADIDPASELLISAGTQASLYLAMSSIVERGAGVAIVTPDYFAYRKITGYLEARPVEIPLSYRDAGEPGVLDLAALERAFSAGSRLLVFSNPNNPTGVIYDATHLSDVYALAESYGAHVIVDQLYCRQIFDQRPFTHLRTLPGASTRVTTLMGPSKTESLSGLRLGVAIGPAELVSRMESLQGIVTLRAPGYSQAALMSWLAEPAGWLESRVSAHQSIRDDIAGVIRESRTVSARLTEGGSYMFLHSLSVEGRLDEFVDRLRVECGVTVTRGFEFGDYPDGFRLNFSQSHAAAVAAVERLVDFSDRF
ncbi:aminotransferase class I/II-fold pyridoxal phosphate-dependent enzyme [Microbacterium sp. RD1]|uniref:aminotransferase class I/II-fold pyridoxal phosphate-dependent enzyme n=1 Tax=Microbacterium sp. RD1 TaxID=3457313 RepID=UPI003FA5AE0A